MDERECRICFEKEPYNFINPCLCDGTSKWVHICCLNQWREINRDKEAYKICMECKYEYDFKLEYKKEKRLYKNNWINKNKVAYLLLLYFFTIPLSFTFETVDYYDNILIKILCFNNTYCINNSKKYYDHETILKNFIYHSAILTIYSNIFIFGFCVHSLNNKIRKKLYFNLMKKRMICIFISLNNLFYSYFPFTELGVPVAYFIFQFLFLMHNLFLTIDIFKTHHKIVRVMNTKFNSRIILNYGYESDEENLLEDLIYEETGKFDENVIIELNNA